MSYSLEGQMIGEMTRTALLLYNMERLQQQVEDKTGKTFEHIRTEGSVWYGYARGIGWKTFTYYLNL